MCAVCDGLERGLSVVFIVYGIWFRGEVPAGDIGYLNVWS